MRTRRRLHETAVSATCAVRDVGHRTAQTASAPSLKNWRIWLGSLRTTMRPKMGERERRPISAAQDLQRDSAIGQRRDTLKGPWDRRAGGQLHCSRRRLVISRGHHTSKLVHTPTPWTARGIRQWPWPGDASRSRRPVDARKASGDSRIGGIRAGERWHDTDFRLVVLERTHHRIADLPPRSRIGNLPG